MRAARFYGKEDLRVEEVPEPTLPEGKAIVEVSWCGICGSDLHDYTQGSLTGATNGPHPLIKEDPPHAMGHEFCGIVRNPTRSDLRDGDAVMVDPRVLCRSCHNCKSGQTYACEMLGFHGYNTNGGFAERIAVDERMLYKLPDHVSVEDAAIIEPLAVVQHGIKMTELDDWASKSVLVLGGGPIGYALILVLRAHGATNIVVSEPTKKRREQVGGFAMAVDPVSENVVAKCKEISGGRGVDVVFDCAGVPAAIETGFKALGLHGQYMTLAVWEKPMVLPLMTFMFKHITVRAALIYEEDDWKTVLKLLEDKKLDGYKQMITTRIKLEDVVEKGFKELLNNRDDHIKILVTTK